MEISVYKIYLIDLWTFNFILYKKSLEREIVSFFLLDFGVIINLSQLNQEKLL